MSSERLAVALAAIFAVLFVAGLVRAPRDPIVELRNRFIKLSRLRKMAAARELDVRVEDLTRRFPGKSYGWYLRWLVRDLERAKEIR